MSGLRSVSSSGCADVFGQLMDDEPYPAIRPQYSLMENNSLVVSLCPAAAMDWNGQRRREVQPLWVLLCN